MAIDPKKIKILLVEDAATMRMIEKKTLQKLGFDNIVEAEDGNRGIAALQNEDDIDIVISDWNMPNKDGLELLEWIRSSEKLKDIPFIMATGHGDKKQEKVAVDAGVSSFVAKPFNGEELKKKIDEAFGVDEKSEEVKKMERIPRTGSSGKVRLKIAHIQITDHLVLGVLKHLIDRGEFTPQYFELESQCMPGWNPVREALEKGYVDAACVLAPIAMDLFSVGVPIRLVLFAHKNGSIFVRNRTGDYTDPYQNFFQGKSFYIPHKMSIHHMLSHMFFSKIGLRPGMVGEESIDVNFEIVDPIRMPEFLRINLDAAGFMVAEPLGTNTIAKGLADLQFLSGEIWEHHPCCVVAIRDDFIGPYPEAVYELTDMLVQSGQFIEKKPEIAAEVAVSFLDPEKKLGLRVPILKNVLREKQGIKTGDLYPDISDLDRIQQYMHRHMNIGSLIDLDKFVDLRFADKACRETMSNRKPSRLHDSREYIQKLLFTGVEEEIKGSKAMLSKEGKYLTFNLAEQEYGIDISKIREIIGMMPIRGIPKADPHVKGVINLRNKVIPVIDLRLKFGMAEKEYNDRSCIIVLEFDIQGRIIQIGVAVDSVSEVLNIKASEIEETPHFGGDIDTDHILAMATVDGDVKILLDIDNVLDFKDVETVEEYL